MADDQAMYAVLFREITAVIEELQNAQRQTEEMYLSAGSVDIQVLDIMKSEDSMPGAGDKPLNKDK